MKLLSSGQSNEKLKKSTGKGYLVFGLSLRPANGSGYNVCAMATAGCKAACVLEFAGRGNMPNVKIARTKKTKLFFENRTLFLQQLHADIKSAKRQADKKDMKCIIRLNVASDIKWETVDPSIFTDNPDVTFYDYTKLVNRRNIPRNYHITYSFNENTDPAVLAWYVRAKRNITVVFDTEYNPAHGKIGALPDLWHGLRVVDGDKHDLRLQEFDGVGNVIGLRGKGGKKIVAAGVASGFIQIGKTSY